MMDDLLHEMINPAPAPRDGARRRRLWTTVVIVGLAAIGATTLTTSAIFTDDDATSAVDPAPATSTSSWAGPSPFDVHAAGPGARLVDLRADDRVERRAPSSCGTRSPTSAPRAPGDGGTGT